MFTNVKEDGDGGGALHAIAVVEEEDPEDGRDEEGRWVGASCQEPADFQSYKMFFDVSLAVVATKITTRLWCTIIGRCLTNQFSAALYK